MIDKTLPQRMREAADVLEEVVARDGGIVLRPGDKPEFRIYSAFTLRTVADKWEREDAEKATRDAKVEELAAALWTARHSSVDNITWDDCGDTVQDYYRTQARDLIAAGWRKQQT